MKMQTIPTPDLSSICNAADLTEVYRLMQEAVAQWDAEIRVYWAADHSPDMRDTALAAIAARAFMADAVRAAMVSLRRREREVP